MQLNKEKVYEYLQRIPHGKVVTYGMIAEYLGNKKYARAVGNLLHKNEDGDKFPCYKVVNCKGKLSENYAFGGMENQRKKLESEDIVVINNHVDLDEFLAEM
jgi:O-6-methylguanine DNA methyltransferase